MKTAVSLDLDIRAHASGVRRVLYASPLVFVGQDFLAMKDETYLLQRVDGIMAEGALVLRHLPQGSAQLATLLKQKNVQRHVVALQGAAAVWRTRKQGVYLVECILSRESIQRCEENAAKPPYRFSDDVYSRPMLTQLLTITVARLLRGSSEAYLAFVDAAETIRHRT